MSFISTSDPIQRCFRNAVRSILYGQNFKQVETLSRVCEVCPPTTDAGGRRGGRRGQERRPINGILASLGGKGVLHHFENGY